MDVGNEKGYLGLWRGPTLLANRGTGSPTLYRWRPPGDAARDRCRRAGLTRKNRKKMRLRFRALFNIELDAGRSRGQREREEVNDGLTVRSRIAGGS